MLIVPVIRWHSFLLMWWKGDIPEVCPLDEAILSDCVSHMSNIAIRTGRRIKWDPEKGEVVDDPEANLWFIREMREPYTV